MVAAIFKEFDTDGGGTISADEFQVKHTAVARLQ